MKNNFVGIPNQKEELLLEYSLLSSLLRELGITYDELIKLISNLERSEEILIVSDFDDTLYSREQQLQNPLLRENRGHKGNEVILQHFGSYSSFVDMHYSLDGLTTHISDLVKQGVSLILTAGIKEFQELKIAKVKLDNIPRVIVSENSIKPTALLRYILLEYKKIPSRIDIYDDRVEHLCRNALLLAELLKTQIRIFEVKLKGTEIENLDIVADHSYNYIQA